MHAYLSIEDSLHEGLDSICGHIITIGLVFGHVFPEVDVAVAGALRGLHSEELQDTLVIVVINVDVDEQNLEGNITVCYNNRKSYFSRESSYGTISFATR